MSSAKRRRSKKKPVRIELSRLAAMGWVLGLLVALLWMFVLGLFVGKGLTPANINLAEIKRKMVKEGVWPGSGKKPQEDKSHSTTTAAQKKIPMRDLEFYEALAKKKQARLSGPNPEAPTTPKTSRAQEASGTTAALPPVSSSEPVRHGTVSKGSLSYYYTVQIASFRNQAAARKFALSLEKLKPPASVQSVDLPGKGRWYRVQVGRFSSREEASALAARLVKEYQLKAFVMRPKQ